MSRTTVGALNVMVGANIRGLNRSFNAASRRVGGFAKTIGRTARRVAMFGAAAAGAATAIGGVLVRRQLRAIDELGKMSDQIDIATEKLVGLQHGADLAGVGTNQLNNALQRMSRRVGLAADGTGAASAMLEQLGFEADKLARMRADEQFAAIADRIAQIEDPARQAAAAYQIFGREGQQLLPMLRQGAAGMEAAQREAERLGLTLNRTDAARIEQANDAMARMRAVVTGAARSLTIALAPAIERGAKLFENIFAAGRDAFTRLVAFAEPIWDQLRSIVVDNAQAMLTMVVERFTAIAGVGRAVFNAIASIVGRVMPSITQQTGGALAAMGRGFMRFQELVTFAFNATEFAITNWRDVLNLALMKAQHAVVRFGNQVHHLFTERIPSVLRWFANNWRDILTTVGANTLTFFENLAGNVGRIIGAIPDLVRGRLSVGDVMDMWQPVTDGFVNVIEAMPDIAEREVGALESELAKGVAALERSVGRDFDQFLDTRRRESEATAERIGGAFAGVFSGLTGDGEGLDPNIPRDFGQDMGDGFSKTAEADLSRDASLELIRAGTAEAQAFAHRMTRAMQRDRIQQNQLRAQQNTASNTAEIARKLDRETQVTIATIAG